MILKDVAQVLRVFEQGNTSQVVALFGRRLGHFRIHAKGARRWSKKGFEGGFDLLSRGEILVYPRHGEGLWILKEWDEHARLPLGKNLELLRAASYLCEFAEAITRHTAGSMVEQIVASPSITDHSNAQFYDLLANAADALVEGKVMGFALLSFTLGALRIEGLLPNFKLCNCCGGKLKKDAQSFYLTSAGARCESCHRALHAAPQNSLIKERIVNLSPETRGVLSHIAETSRPAQVSANAAEQLARAMILLVHGALEYEPRALLTAARMVRAMGYRL